jgi:hypothetical protein
MRRTASRPTDIVNMILFHDDHEFEQVTAQNKVLRMLHRVQIYSSGKVSMGINEINSSEQHLHWIMEGGTN